MYHQTNVMKLKPSTTRIINIFLISTCLLIDIGYLVYYYQSKYVTKIYPNGSTWTNNLKPIDEPISSDLPHKKFEELQKQQRLERLFKNGEISAGYWSFFNTIGTGGYRMCDSCDYLKGIKPSKPFYFISLLGWKLKSTAAPEPFLDSVVFHVEHRQPYIRKAFTEREGNSYSQEIKDIPVKFMYSHPFQTLKIPVSEGLKKTLTAIIQIASVMFLLIGFYAALTFVKLIISLRDGADFNNRNSFLQGLAIVLSFPLFLVLELFQLLRREIFNNDPLTDVSENTERLVFTDQNILRLQVLAYTLTGFPIFLFSLTLLMRLIFSSYFIEDVVLNTARLYPWWITMHVGIIFLLLLNTFKQGKALKDEQDLTV